MMQPACAGWLLEAQSRPYDREKGGEQAGTKRSARTDRFGRDRVLKHLDGKMLAGDVTPETIIRLAEAIAREPKAPAKVTRRKHLAFLRRVFSWAAERPSESGIRFSPFAHLTRQERRELFPKPGKRGFVFTPEQLRGLYALAGWRRPLIRFAVHTGMRFGELPTLFRRGWIFTRHK
jgi:integrase